VSKRKQQTDEVVVSSRPGEKLREAREALQLSVEDVAARLKLGTEKIAALEQSDVEAFTAPVFVAGYLRAYARLLELSEAEVLADFEILLSVQEPVIDSGLNADDFPHGKVASEISSQFSLREKSSGKYLPIAGVAAALVLALVYFLWPTGDDTSVRVAAVTETAPALEQNGTRTLPLPKEKTPSVTPMVVQDTQAVTEVVEAVRAETPDASAPTVEALAMGMKSELTLVFRDDSWAEVKDAREQRLVYRLGKAGSTRTVTGVAPFAVQLGYVQGVDILYNGGAYDLSKYAKRRSVQLRIGDVGDRMGGG
jgi:cytoskeleton protein RodZ